MEYHSWFVEHNLWSSVTLLWMNQGWITDDSPRVVNLGLWCHLGIINFKCSLNIMCTQCLELNFFCQEIGFFGLLPIPWIFFVSTAKVLDLSGFFCQKLQKFLGLLSAILKNLAYLAKNSCQYLGNKSQKSKIPIIGCHHFAEEISSHNSILQLQDIKLNA